MEIGRKPSHIIIYVDKQQKNEDICVFCTKASLENEDIKIIFQCYDNQMPVKEQMDNLFDMLTEDAKDTLYTKGLFFVVDNTQACEYLSKKGIAFAAYTTSYNRGQSFRKALYCIEDIDYVECNTLIRMWQRFRGIAWVIATTKRTVIREQTLDDIDDLYRMYADPYVVKYMENLYSDKDEEIAYMKDYIANQYKYCEYGVWAITDSVTGTYIGRAGISQRPGYDELELGYVIAKEYRGRGYASEVCRAIIEYMKEMYDIESLIAFTHKDNIASVALLRKLGFEYCQSECINGGLHDMYRRVLT